eukprot:gene21033-biopygen1082
MLRRRRRTNGGKYKDAAPQAAPKRSGKSEAICGVAGAAEGGKL